MLALLWICCFGRNDGNSFFQEVLSLQLPFWYVYIFPILKLSTNASNLWKQIPLLIVDSNFYGRFVIAPLNIVLYNVFSEHGPDLYGTSPWTFYFLNGFLNFNVVFILALMSLPVVLITWKVEESKNQRIPAWLALIPLYTWILIFFTRPHKVKKLLECNLFVNYLNSCLFFLGRKVSLSNLPFDWVGRSSNMESVRVGMESFSSTRGTDALVNLWACGIVVGNFSKPDYWTVQR